MAFADAKSESSSFWASFKTRKKLYFAPKKISDKFFGGSGQYLISLCTPEGTYIFANGPYYQLSPFIAMND
jgi:hypothetical protein